MNFIFSSDLVTDVGRRGPVLLLHLLPADDVLLLGVDGGLGQPHEVRHRPQHVDLLLDVRHAAAAARALRLLAAAVVPAGGRDRGALGDDLQRRGGRAEVGTLGRLQPRPGLVLRDAQLGELESAGPRAGA